MRLNSTLRRTALRVATIATLTITGIHCASGGLNLYPKSDDVKLGQQMAAQIAADPAHYPILNNPTLTDYLQSVENRIVASPNVKNKDFHYTVKIINDPNTINAFTIPGGGIYVYTGLLKFIDDESALAGVLAHETTHADHRHATRNMSEQLGLSELTGILLGTNTGALVTAAANVGTQLTVLKFSRADETEADQGSFDDLNQLPGKPWYPAGANQFLKKSLASSASQPGPLQQMLLTHPVDQDRIDALTNAAKKAGVPAAATQAQLNASTYQRYKAMLP